VTAAELPEELQFAWQQRDFQRIAEAMDTGDGDQSLTRALIIFNLSDSRISGAACFHVDMRWRVGRALPPIRMSHRKSGEVVDCRVTSLTLHEGDRDDEYGRIRFDLLFAVEPIDAACWDAFVAEYLDHPEHTSIAELPALIDETS